MFVSLRYTSRLPCDGEVVRDTASNLKVLLTSDESDRDLCADSTGYRNEKGADAGSRIKHSFTLRLLRYLITKSLMNEGTYPDSYLGAILGRAGRRLVVHTSQSWGGLMTRIPLLDSILACAIPTSPKLDQALVT